MTFHDILFGAGLLSLLAGALGAGLLVRRNRRSRILELACSAAFSLGFALLVQAATTTPAEWSPKP